MALDRRSHMAPGIWPAVEEGLRITKWLWTSVRVSMENNCPIHQCPVPRLVLLYMGGYLLRWKNGAKQNQLDRLKGSFSRRHQKGALRNGILKLKEHRVGHWIPENGQGHSTDRPDLLWGTEAVLFSEDFTTDFWVLEPKDLFLYNLCVCERAPSGSHAASCTKDMLQKHSGQDTNGENHNQMIQYWLHISSQLPTAQGLSQWAATACLVNNPPHFSLLQNYLKRKKKKVV